MSSQVNIGEPSCAISFGGRGRKSILPADVVPRAGDHDFHVVSLTPSVTLVVDFDGTESRDLGLTSFYKGQAHVCLKDAIFQPSHAERHAVEFGQLLAGCPTPYPALFVMTDGGPDHNCRHLSVQMSWLGFFILSGLDMLVVHRAAPTQSWTNPAERVMGPLNLAMQNMALCRTKMDNDFEAAMHRCNGMAAVRTLHEEQCANATTPPLDQHETSPTQPMEVQPAGLAASREGNLYSSDIQQHAIVAPPLDQHEAPPPQPMEQQPVGLAAGKEGNLCSSDIQQPDIVALPLDEHETSPTRPIEQQPTVVAPPLDWHEPTTTCVVNTIDLFDSDSAMSSDNSDSDDVITLDDTNEELIEPVPSPLPPPVNDKPTSFITTYMASLKKVMSAIEQQIARATWASSRIQVHPPAEDEEVSW